MDDLNGYVLERAHENHICAEWAERIGNASRDEMMEMYVKGIDFCLDNNFPSNADLIKHVGDLLPNYGVFVGKRVSEINQPFVVLLGTCNADLTYDEYSAGRVYVKHSCVVRLQVSGEAKVYVDCYDDCNVTVVCEGKAKVVVYKYDNSQVTSEGNGSVKVINKRKV